MLSLSFLFSLLLISPTFANVSLSSLSMRQRRLVPACGGFCRFRLCNTNQEGVSFRLPKAAFILFSPRNFPTLPYICLSRTSIGQIQTTLEPSVAVDPRGRQLVPISKWSPEGLRKSFNPDFIQPKRIRGFPWSGIDRKRATVNQWRMLHDRCMVLPIRKYQLIDSDTQRPVGTVDLDDDRRNCVAFRTSAPSIHVQLTWDSSDDFDLSVEEPEGGAVIDFRNTRSDTGKLNRDNHKGFCNANLPAGREDIVYFPNPALISGVYRVRVTHFNACGGKESKWSLKIMKNGVVVKSRRGKSDVGLNKKVLETIFRFP